MLVIINFKKHTVIYEFLEFKIDKRTSCVRGVALARQSGQLPCEKSHMSIHVTWKICAHSGIILTSSFSSNSPKQTAHVPSLNSFVYLWTANKVDEPLELEALVVVNDELAVESRSILTLGLRCISGGLAGEVVSSLGPLRQFTSMQWIIATIIAPDTTPRTPTRSGESSMVEKN